MLVHMVEMFLASFTGEIKEHIAFKQIMFGSFNSTTNTQRTVYDIFRMEMVIGRAEICSQSSMVYLASAFLPSR